MFFILLDSGMLHCAVINTEHQHSYRKNVLFTSSLSMWPDVSLSTALNIRSSCAGETLLLRCLRITFFTYVQNSIKHPGIHDQ